MHTVFALLCFVVVIHWLIFPYPSGLLHWHCGNLTIAPVPAKQPWWIWINTSCEFIMNDCITTTKQSTTKPCAYFLGYTVVSSRQTCISTKLSLLLIEKTALCRCKLRFHYLQGCDYLDDDLLSSVEAISWYIWYNHLFWHSSQSIHIYIYTWLTLYTAA